MLVSSHSPEIFISYKREPASIRLVKELITYLEEAFPHLRVVWDEEELNTGASISAYMDRLTKGDFIIFILSPAFLESPWCMYELALTADYTDYKERVFHLMFPGLNIGSAGDVAKITKYWQQKWKELKQDIDEIAALNEEHVANEFLDELRIASEVVKGSAKALLHMRRTMGLTVDDQGIVNRDALQGFLNGWIKPKKESIASTVDVSNLVNSHTLLIILNLPTAKMFSPYFQKIDLGNLHRKIETLKSYHSGGFKEIGMNLVVDNYIQITGVPATHGKFPVSILLSFASDGFLAAQDYLLNGEIDIVLNPDGFQVYEEMVSTRSNNTSESLDVSPTLPILRVRLNIPNGKVGMDYKQKIDISPLDRSISSLNEFKSEGFAHFGLKFDYDIDLVISGSPTHIGKFPFSIMLHFVREGDRPAQKYKLEGEIEIHPNPMIISKEIEPDDSLPYPKPHLASAIWNMGGRTSIAASRRGILHANLGRYREDDFKLSSNKSHDWYIMAVAGGDGSGLYSHRGAQIAVERAVEVLSLKLDTVLNDDLGKLGSTWIHDPTDQLHREIRSRIHGALSQAAFAGYRAICEEANTLNEPTSTFETTLILTIVRKYDFGYFVGTWQVGDGAMVIMQESNYFNLMGHPEYRQANGQPRFLTRPEVWIDDISVLKRIDFDVVEDFTAIILMTGGVFRPKFGSVFDYLQQDDWDKFWAELNEKVAFDNNNYSATDQLLDWLSFEVEGEIDDRTIAILF